jgi:hypothetical protein
MVVMLHAERDVSSNIADSTLPARSERGSADSDQSAENLVSLVQVQNSRARSIGQELHVPVEIGCQVKICAHQIGSALKGLSRHRMTCAAAASENMHVESI